MQPRSGKPFGNMLLAAGPPRTTRDFWISLPARNRQALMTTKKKSRPLFEVPAEVESGAQSGWVYRSGAGGETVSRIEASSRGAETDVDAESAATATLAMALAAVAQA